MHLDVNGEKSQLEVVSNKKLCLRELFLQIASKCHLTNNPNLYQFRFYSPDAKLEESVWSLTSDLDGQTVRLRQPKQS